MEFPLGIFGIALGTVTLPYLSRLWAKNDRKTFAQTLDWSLKLAMLIALPAAIGLFLLSEPLVTTLFFGGVFDEHAVRMTAMALRAYAAGLLGFSFVKILAPAYFAQEDTKTPVRIALLALLINLVLSISLAGYMSSAGMSGPHAGLSAATSVAAIVNAALLYQGLRKAGILIHGGGWLALLLRMFVGCFGMIAVLYWMYRPLQWWIDAPFGNRLAWLAITVGIAAGTYFMALWVFGARLSQFRLRAS